MLTEILILACCIVISVLTICVSLLHVYGNPRDKTQCSTFTMPIPPVPISLELRRPSAS